MDDNKRIEKWVGGIRSVFIENAHMRTKLLRSHFKHQLATAYLMKANKNDHPNLAGQIETVDWWADVIWQSRRG